MIVFVYFHLPNHAVGICISIDLFVRRNKETKIVNKSALNNVDLLIRKSHCAKYSVIVAM